MKGSHNTLTYARPLKWWGWPLLPIWRCQSKDIDRQIDEGTIGFDIRVAFDRRSSQWRGAHGPVLLNVDPIRVINTIQMRRPGAYVRVILEREDNLEVRFRFAELCEHLERIFPELNFFGGNLKSTWAQVYAFSSLKGQAAEEKLLQINGAMCSRWGKIWPWLWWRLNRESIKPRLKTPNHAIILTDFV